MSGRIEIYQLFDKTLGCRIWKKKYETCLDTDTCNLDDFLRNAELTKYLTCVFVCMRERARTMLKLLFIKKNSLSRNSYIFSLVKFILSVHGCDDSKVIDNVKSLI